MEDTKFPIVIKKKNSMMIGVSIIEIVIGIIFGATSGGIKSIPLWLFIFTGVVTALSVLVEYNQDIIIKENKIEFYKNNDLIKEVKYADIKSIFVGKGNEPKNKKKDFFAIGFSKESKKSNKNAKEETYLINPMTYSAKDFEVIKNIIVKNNSCVKIGEGIDKFTNKN